MNDALATRLESLCEGLSFRSDFDQAPDSLDHLMQITKHNLREFEKLDGERLERIQNLVSAIMASIVQREAIAKYGISSATPQILLDWLNEPETRAYWDRLTESAKQRAAGWNLEEAQRETVFEFIDMLPKFTLGLFEELIHPLRLLPLAEAQRIVSVLADMLKETQHADTLGHS